MLFLFTLPASIGSCSVWFQVAIGQIENFELNLNGTGWAGGQFDRTDAILVTASRLLRLAVILRIVVLRRQRHDPIVVQSFSDDRSIFTFVQKKALRSVRILKTNVV